VMSVILLPTLYVWIARADDRLPEPIGPEPGAARADGAS